MICAIFPPSSIKPRRIPVSATATPKKVLLSIRSSGGFPVLYGCGQRGRNNSGEIRWRRGKACQNRAAKRNDEFKHLLRRFAHDDFVPRNQRKNRVRGVLHQLDEVAIDDQRMVVQSGELNHLGSLSLGCASLHLRLSAERPQGLRVRSTGRALS